MKNNANTFDTLIDDLTNSDYDMEDLLKSLPEPYASDLLREWNEVLEELEITKIMNSETETLSQAEKRTLKLNKELNKMARTLTLLNCELRQAKELEGW